jgi:hypothetical protein
MSVCRYTLIYEQTVWLPPGLTVRGAVHARHHPQRRRRERHLRLHHQSGAGRYRSPRHKMPSDSRNEFRNALDNCCAKYLHCLATNSEAASKMARNSEPRGVEPNTDSQDASASRALTPCFLS